MIGARPGGDLVARYRRAQVAADGATRDLGLEEVLLGHDCLRELPAVVARLSCSRADVRVLTDASPKYRAGQDLHDQVVDLLRGAGHRVTVTVLGPSSGDVHATAEVRVAATEAAAGADAVVSIGSGTVTDLAKDAVANDGGAPLVAVQTAVSVNGFSDDLAVVLIDGVKRTIPSVWPRALLIDTAVLLDAPSRLNRAGVGELLAMFTAPADWLLASMVAQDPSFSAPLVALFRDDGPKLFEIAGGVREAEPAALEELARMMTASGVALGLAGRTAPISGMEHTVSHLLDMSGARVELPVGLHGEQVGVAAVVVACLWQRLLEHDDLWDRATEPDFAVMEAKVRAAFHDLDPTGTMGGECWRDYRRKLERWHGSTRVRLGLAATWDEHRAALRNLLAPAEQMVGALRDAGAPRRFRDLSVPVTAERARWAITHCHLMRDRFTVADLAFLTDAWNEDDITAVLDHAADSGGGL